MTSWNKPGLSQRQLEIVAFLEANPNASTRQVAGAMGIELSGCGATLRGLYTRGVIGRQMSLLHGGSTFWSAGEPVVVGEEAAG